jgi:hypothetical protein
MNNILDKKNIRFFKFSNIEINGGHVIQNSSSLNKKYQ